MVDDSVATMLTVERTRVLHPPMRALQYWKTVAMDEADFLGSLVKLLQKHRVRFYVIGGQGVNAYVDPLVSLDLDLVVAAEDMSRLEPLLSESFRVERFPDSLNLSQPGSELRAQIQTDPQYAAFVEGAAERDVLGLRLRVARLEDILSGKIWAVEDSTRRASKRQKDLADVARILEFRPELRARVPQAVLARLV